MAGGGHLHGHLPGEARWEDELGGLAIPPLLPPFVVFFVVASLSKLVKLKHTTAKPQGPFLTQT